MQIELTEILETIRMTEVEHFDIRTVTMGINLKDCTSDNIESLKQNIYDKVMRSASEHVKTAEMIESQYGISIANKRVSITPLAIVADGFYVEGFCRNCECLRQSCK